MIEATELDDMRAAVLDLMPDTCSILNPTTAVDTQGAVTQTWGTVTASSQCRMDYRDGKTLIDHASLQGYTGFVLTLPYNTSVASGYRIIYSGDTYNVTAVDVDKSWNIQTVCKVEKL